MYKNVLKPGMLVKYVENNKLCYAWENKRKPINNGVYYICHMYPGIVYLSKNNNCRIKNLGQHDGIGTIVHEECLILHKLETYCI